MTDIAFKCPMCSYEVFESDSEALFPHVTYWGDDGPVKHSCDRCGHDFAVKEIVRREWEVLWDKAND